MCRGYGKGHIVLLDQLTCIKERISLIAMLLYTVFVTVYIQVSSNILMFIEQVHLLLLFTSKSRPLAPPTSGSRVVLAHTLHLKVKRILPFEIHTGAAPLSHTSNYQRYRLQLAQSEATTIIQRDTLVDYTLLVLLDRHYLSPYTK